MASVVDLINAAKKSARKDDQVIHETSAVSDRLKSARESAQQEDKIRKRQTVLPTASQSRNSAGIELPGGSEQGGALSGLTLLPSSPQQAARDFAYASERIGAGLLGAAEGVSDFLGAGFGKAVQGITSLGGLAPNPVSEWGGRVAEHYLTTSPTQEYEENIRQRYNPTRGAETVTGVEQTIAQMLPGIGAARAVSAVGQVGNALNAAQAAQRGANAGRALFGLQAAGQSAQQAKEEGATTNEALAYGAASGLLESAIEGIAGGIPALGKGRLNDVVSAVTKNPVLNRAADIAGEGAEEALSTAVTPYLQRAMYNPEAENATPREILQSAALGSLAAGVLQGGLELPGAVSRTVSDIRDVRQAVGSNQDIINRANQRISQDMQARREAVNPLLTMLPTAEEFQNRQAGSPVYQRAMRAELPVGGRQISDQTGRSGMSLDGDTIYRENENTEPTSDGRASLSGAFDTVVSSVSNNSILPGGQEVNANPRNQGIQIPVESRTWEDASNRKVNAFQYDHPELHPYYSQAAQVLRSELASGTRGERYPLLDQDGYVTGYTGTRRAQASPIEQALDNANLSYNDIDRALTAIIHNQGQENYAAAKKMELVLDDMLSNGYTDADGREVGPNERYVAARDVVNRGIPAESTEYRMSQEEWNSLQRSEPEVIEPFSAELPRAVPLEDTAEIYDIYGSGRENLPENSVGANKASPWGEFVASSKEFFPEGANAARDVDVPTTDPQGRRIRKTAATAMGAKAIPDEAIADIQNMVLRGELSYNRVSDKSSIDRAVKTIQDKGYQGALEEFRNSVSKGVVSKDIATLGQQLLINAANAGDGKTTSELLTLYAQMETTAGQAVQAASILRKLAPSDQLYAAQRTVSDLEKTIRKNYKDIEITIDQSLIEEFGNQTTQEGRDQVLDKIYQNVADQIPSTWKDKWNAWRYLAMLGNPRTHIRNIAGNVFFQPLRIVKDRTAAAIEAGVSLASGGRLQRTKSFAANPALYKAAWNDWGNVRNVLSGNKYDDIRSEINSRRRIFRAKPLELARTGNSWLLEFEDTIFKQITYADALAGYLQANGVTAEQMQNNTVDANLMARARDYAGQEALRATYQDRNKVSDKVVQVANVLGPAGEAILPFKRTPANILVRGLEYSPAGLAKALTADLIQVKRGNMTGAESIDHIASGLTGSALFALGAYLFSQGIVTSGGGDDENQDRLNELTGGQNYALNLPGGGNVTLDWLAPEALPFFMGVELMDSMGQSGNTTDSIMTALKSVSDPMLELSMLQSLNDVIDSVSFSENKLGALASSAVVSYFTQAIPTLGGQFERTGEENRMSTYTDKALTIDLPGGLPEVGVPTDVQYAIGRASARIPGWDYQQIPYIDAWGREESNGPLVLRAGNNFLNPAYTSSLNVTPVDEEIQRLYTQTGDGGVVPDRPNRYITVNGERVDLSAEQYVQYATERGQMQYDMLNSLIDRSAYQRLTDSEKAAVISDVYQYADAVTKAEISDYKPDSWIAKAQSSGVDPTSYILYRSSSEDGMTLQDKDKAMTAAGITGNGKARLLISENPDWADDAKEAGVTQNVFVEYKLLTSGLTGDKDAEGNTISGSKKAKVLSAINSMDIDSETKDALYYAAGYAASGIRDTPWH